jgi:hypothetical protein
LATPIGNLHLRAIPCACLLFALAACGGGGSDTSAAAGGATAAGTSAATAGTSAATAGAATDGAVVASAGGDTGAAANSSADVLASNSHVAGSNNGNGVPTDTSGAASTGTTANGATGTAGTTTTTATASGVRDPLKWPFAANSIWNMPIGSGAQYVPANLPADPGSDVWAPMPQVDDELIVMKPTAPATAIKASSVGWSGGNRCNATGGVLTTVPMPASFVVANSKANNSTTFLSADGRTLLQTQPFTRCTSGGTATSMAVFPSQDIQGDGRTGAHGGSGLSAFGGSIRVGELRPGSQGPRHALKVNVFARQSLYKCTTRADCYRWPATRGDSYAVGFYGTVSGNTNKAMKMGSLLAIPASTNITTMGLETAPGKQLAWTLQNYGAYIVDDTYSAGFAINAENGPDGSVRTQFQADYGYALEQRVNGNTPWVRDMQRLIQALYVVDNNSATSIGGGGTPRQPLAPAFK